MASPYAASPRAGDLQALTAKALHYYSMNNVTVTIEDVLNKMFKDNPDDIHGYIAEYYSLIAKKPVILKIKGRQVYDGKGRPTLQTDVYCKINGHEKMMARTAVASVQSISENASLDNLTAEDKRNTIDCGCAVDLINDEINSAIADMDPCHQKYADEILRELSKELQLNHERQLNENVPEEADDQPPSEVAPSREKSPAKGKADKKSAEKPAEKKEAAEVPDLSLYPGCNSIAATSVAVLSAGASCSKRSLLEHVQYLYSESVSVKPLPTPMVGVLYSGKTAPGKQMLIKELMITPKPGINISKGLADIGVVVRYMGNSMSQKAGITIRNVTESGCYCVPYDRSELMLDAVSEAVSACGYSVDDDFKFIINCSATDLFDQEKQKYEVLTGMLKSADEMVELYVDLVTRYPQIVGIIDPFTVQDRYGWSTLAERLSDKCYLIGEENYKKPHDVLAEPISVIHSGGLLCIQHTTTVSCVLDVCKQLQDNGKCVVISASRGETSDTCLADIAVAVGARFVKFGGLQRGECTSKYNRLIEIEELLSENGKLSVYEEYEFPSILPIAEEEPEADGDTNEICDEIGE